MANPEPPTVMVRTDDSGNEIERIAYTPSDLVKFQFDGWRPKSQPKKSTAKTTTETSDAKASGTK